MIIIVSSFIVEIKTKRQRSRFSLRKNDLFPLFGAVVYENGKIIWRLVLISSCMGCVCYPLHSPILFLLFPPFIYPLFPPIISSFFLLSFSSFFLLSFSIFYQYGTSPSQLLFISIPSPSNAKTDPSIHYCCYY